ncbi:MAG: D-amino acid aminotransferase [gamma proteobacterium symbiont of Bathyaustriella thionipta]|nr:D-amino acid aminotransferase [gamma proteobacterium symbiont of Bathyaustriella thionipta]
MHNQVYLNGRFLPQNEAHVSVMDRGFLFADGVYEVIPVYGGRLFRLQEHLQRLHNSLAAIEINSPLNDSQWEDILHKLMAQYPGQDQSVYVQITRGADSKRDHSINPHLTPTVFCSTSPLSDSRTAAVRKGIRAITLDDNRWTRCDIKAIALLANVLLKQEASRRNALEAILLRDGKAQEGSASNLFIVTDGLLITPPTGNCLLSGVTRDLILQLADEQDIRYQESDVSLPQLQQADEIWLTSSTREIMPVTFLDDKAVGNAAPGALWHIMMQHYQHYKALFIAGEVD